MQHHTGSQNFKLSRKGMVAKMQTRLLDCSPLNCFGSWKKAIIFLIPKLTLL